MITLHERLNVVAESIINACNSEDLDWLELNHFFLDGDMTRQFIERIPYLLESFDFMEAMERIMENHNYAYNTHDSLKFALDNVIYNLLKPRTKGAGK